MKKAVTMIAFCLLAPAAWAGSSWESKYWDYVESIGDATPLGKYEWGVRNGYLPDNSRKERIRLTWEEQAEIARLNSYGDSTPPTEFKPGTAPRRALTPLEVEYLRFSSTYGDSTPPSFSDWKASRGK